MRISWGAGHRGWGVRLLTLSAAFFVVGSRCPAQVNPFGPLGSAGEMEANPAASTVVVYNANEPMSRELAEYYAGKRKIPAEQLVGLKCPAEEEISRQEYDDTLAGPLRAAFDAHGWWQRTADQPGHDPSSVVTRNQMHYLALIRGIPLRIKQTSGYPGDVADQPQPLKDANGACVDSELTVLGAFTHRISGFIPNPYFGSYSHFPDAHCPPAVMLAARLDAPTGVVVRRMIDDSLAAEKTGLWGRCYLDRRGLTAGPHKEGDEWLTRILKDDAPFLMPTVDDNREATYGANYPMTDAALYFGWYTQDVSGPFKQPDFRFRPGAVVCHIHSFSATSLRDPTRWWVAPLLDKGAAAVMGNVYEPYLTFTTHLDIFLERLRDGFNLAESAYAAQRGLSWMNTVVGDPLYRPGLVWNNLKSDLDDPATPGEPASVAEGRAYWRGAQVWHARGAEAGAAALEKSAERFKSGFIYEGLGLLQAAQGDKTRAMPAFERAIRAYKKPADAVRVTMHEARLLSSTDKKAEALVLLRAAKQRYAGTPEAASLDELMNEVTQPF